MRNMSFLVGSIPSPRAMITAAESADIQQLSGRKGPVRRGGLHMNAIAIRSTHPAVVGVAAGLVLVVQLLHPGSALAADAAPAHGDCAQLTALKLPEVQITEAVAAAAGGAAKVTHCRVAGVI